MTETPTPDVTSQILAELGRQRLSRQDLATKLGKGPMWVTRRLNGEVPMTVADLAAIAEALGAELAVRFDAPAPTS